MDVHNPGIQKDFDFTIQRVRDKVKDDKVILVYQGVDSSVAAMLIHKAVARIYSAFLLILVC